MNLSRQIGNSFAALFYKIVLSIAMKESDWFCKNKLLVKKVIRIKSRIVLFCLLFVGFTVILRRQSHMLEAFSALCSNIIIAGVVLKCKSLDK